MSIDTQEETHTNDWPTESENIKEASDSTAEASIYRQKRMGRRTKYPALYNLMISNQDDNEVAYENRDGVIVASIGKQRVPVYIPEESGRDDTDPSTSSDEPKVSRYALLKMKAKEEGRLEEFMDANKRRVARQRAEMRIEDKKSMAKYEYARRKMNREALKVTNPKEAERQEEERKAMIRNASKRHYHAHIEEARERNKVNYYKYKGGEVQETPAGSSSRERVVHDFDLNDEAPFTDVIDEEHVEDQYE